jgi:hypothetical protein
MDYLYRIVETKVLFVDPNIDRLCGLVVSGPGYRPIGSGSIPGAGIFISEK